MKCTGMHEARKMRKRAEELGMKVMMGLHDRDLLRHLGLRHNFTWVRILLASTGR